MSILGRLRDGVRAAFQPATITNSADLARMMYGSGGDGESVTVTSAMRQAAVYRCANVLSGVMGGARTRIIDRLSFEEAEGHDVERLINHSPNGYQSGFEFKKLLTLMAIFEGNGCAQKIRSGNRVSSLLPMVGGVIIDRAEDGAIWYNWTNESGRTLKLHQRDVFHVRGMTFNGWRGVSMLTYARSAIGMSQIVNRHGEKFFKDGTKVSGLLRTDNALSDGAFDRIKESIREFSSGGDSEMETMILEEGLDWKPVALNAVDAQYIDNRKLSIIDICIFFGVPPHIIGFTEANTSYGQGVQEQGRAFINYGLSDPIGWWEGAITRGLLPRGGKDEADMDMSHLTRGNENDAWQANRHKREIGVFSPNEIRHANRMPRRKDGKGDDYSELPNVAKADEDPAQKEAPKENDQ